MRQYIKKYLLLLMSILISIVANAYDFEVGGIYYNKDGNCAIVTSGDSNYSGDVSIPSTVNYGGMEYSVTSIGYRAFYQCSGLTSVTIPNSVTSIGNWAFSGCSGLTSMTIGNSVTSIGDQAFNGCIGLTSVHIKDLAAWCKITFNNSTSNPLYFAHHLYLKGEEIKDLVIPNSVTSIGERAFYYCTDLTSVTIPNSVTSIGDWAFFRCTGLTSVTIPNSVTSIGNGAFCFCSGLTSIKVESGNTTYDSRNDCNAIIETASNTLVTGCKNTVIPNSVTSIEGDAFYGCSGLTSVTIPNSVTSIEGGAFEGCTGLTSVTIPNSVTSIGNSAFYKCTDLTSVTIPNSVTSIGNWAFSGCSGLTSIKVESGNTTYDSRNDCNAIILTASNTLVAGCKNTVIPNSVTSIGDYAFHYCSGLTSVTIPNSVTSIGNGAFFYCTGLTSVAIPNSVTSIGDWAFKGCDGLTSIKVESGNPTYDSRNDCNAIILTASNTLVAGCKNTVIPNSVTSIGTYAFEGCSSLTSVTIPNSVTSIGNYAFRECSGLTSVTIPNSVTSIGDLAFSSCSGLTSVTIPNSVTSIGESAFQDCSNLKSVISEIERPFTISSYVFDSATENNGQLTVPKGKKSVYQSTNGWKEFSNIVESISSYTLTIQSSSGGSVSYNGTDISATTKTFTIEEGSSVTITITPNTGYYLSKLTVNGTNVTSKVSSNSYTINSISANTTVVATFTQITYTLSIKASGSGSVTYNGTSTKNTTRTFTVSHGSSATLTITPDSGYRLASLTVNGTDVTSGVTSNKYTISSVTSNTSVVATFEQIPVTTYSLSIQSGSGGSVSYDGTTFTNTTRSFTVNEGTSATITITPNTGYKLSKLTVNGTDVTSSVKDNQYTISNISANTTIVATFEQITYTLSVQATGNGSVAYNGTSAKNNTRTFEVNHGSSATLTITPDAGYRLASLTVNGTNVTSSVSNNRYIISNITANTTVVATFEQIPPTTYSLSIQSGIGGSVSYNGTTVTNATQSFVMTEGSSATITVTPNSGYKLLALTVNGNDVTASVTNNQYTISNITENTTVVATFKALPQTISVDGINYEMRSAADYTLNVGKGNYSGHVVIPATVSYDGDTWTVAGVVDGAFNLSAITAITWNPNTAIGDEAFGAQTNPNLLLYVKSEAYAPSNVQNVIANGRAKKIVLTDAASGNDFNCPVAFTAEEISYSHRYGMTTGIGECRGWEAIALPFDVKQFTHESKGTLIPFKVFSSTSTGKPFWLYRLTATGWQEAANIEANTPYIISLPNNRAYDNDYNLPGVMTFSSSNVTVPVTEAVRSTYGDRTFVANFTSQSASWSIYALNVNNDLSSYSDYLPEGSTFIRELRTVHPFEAYMMNSSGNAKQFLPLFETLPTAIREIPMQGMRGVKGVRIYSMSGELIMFDQNISIEEALKRLKRGVYFVNGKKMVVK